MAWRPDYVTAAELRSYLRIGDAVDDTQLALNVAAASRAVDRHTHRQFGKVDAPEIRRYTARRIGLNGCRWYVEFDDLMTATGLTITTDAGAVDDFTLYPLNAAAEGKPWTHVKVSAESTTQPTAEDGGVSITATWGWTAVPPPVKQATLLQASRLSARRSSPFGVAGSPDLGSELRLLAKVDPDVAVVLGPYIRWWAAA